VPPLDDFINVSRHFQNLRWVLFQLSFISALARLRCSCIRLDNGGEYTSNAFKEFCATSGIKKELTVSYNPQQNNVSERKNMSIVGAAKAMLHDQEFPMFLWVEACNTAVYLQNRVCTKCIGEDDA
jgi:hypothetical protein